MIIAHWSLVIGLPIVLLLPGYLTLHLPFWGKTGIIARLDPDPTPSLEQRVIVNREHREGRYGQLLFLSLLISVLISGLIGLVLAQVGIFSLGSLLLILAIYSVLCLAFIVIKGESFFNRRRACPDPFDCAQDEPVEGFLNQSGVLSLSEGEKGSLTSPLPTAGPKRPDWEDAVVILLFCLSLLLYASRPAEYILGWLDAGWYVNTGVKIAKTGSLTTESKVFSALPSSAKPLFYSSFASLKGMFPYFPDTESKGFYLWAFAVANPDTGVLTAYHPPLFSVWIAIFHALGGLRFSLYATPFFGALGVLSLYFAGRAMFGRKVGLLAALLLAISFTQIYFSRMPFSEVLSQCLLFSGIYALTTWTSFDRRRSLMHAIIAALCSGQVILCRIEGLIVILPLILFFGCGMILHRISPKHVISFAFPYALLLADGVVLAYTVSKPYVELNSYGLWYKLRSLLSQSPALLITAGFLLGTLLVLFAFLGLLHPLEGRSGGWLRRINEERSLITTLLALAILLVATYVYFIYPLSEDSNFTQLGQLLSPLGLWLGIVGLVELIRRDINERTVFFLILMLAHGLATTSVLAISATLLPLYSIRRQVPMLIPSLILLASYAILAWGRYVTSASKGKGVLVRIAQGIVVGVLVIGFLALDIPYLNTREMAGAIAFSERLASHFDEQDIVIFEEIFIQDSRVGHFAAPLWAVYDKNALLMSTPNIEEEALAAALTGWLEAGKEVYFVTQSAPPFLFSGGYKLMLVSEDKWHSSTTTLWAFPPKVLEFEMPFYIYQIMEGESL